MKKITRFLLCVALLFCIGSFRTLAVDKNEIIGTYILTDMEGSSGDNDAAMIEIMSARGLIGTLEIHENGDAVLDYSGVTLPMEFNFAKGTVKMGRDPAPFSFEAGVLEIHNNGGTMTFTKGASPQLSFDYYVAEAWAENGKEGVYSDYDEGPELYVFKRGGGFFCEDGNLMAVVFDFDKKTVLPANGTGEELPFTLEGDLLTLQFDQTTSFSFRRSDPGWQGQYVLCALSSKTFGDMSNAVENASDRNRRLFVLTIDKNGMGTLEMNDVVSDEPLGFESFDFENLVCTVETPEHDILYKGSFTYTYENGVLTIFEGGQNVMTYKRIFSDKEMERFRYE